MQTTLQVWATAPYRRELGLGPFTALSHEHHPLTDPMLLVQVIPVGLELSNPLGQSSARRQVLFLFLEVVVSLGHAQGPSLAPPAGQGAHPHLEDCAVQGKNVSGSSHVYLGQKEGVV